MARTIARRVERLRGLRFDRPPRVVVMGEDRLAKVGRSLARRAQRLERMHPVRLGARRRLERASVALDQLAGLLPPESGFGPDTRPTGLDRIGGAFDYPRNRIIVVPTIIGTRVQLEYTLAHEFTHALESQHFNLRLGTLTHPSEAASARRAVVEGSATLVQDLYQHRYLHDDVPLGERIDGARSLIGSNPEPYAINAQAVFDYVDGAEFMLHLYRRAGGWDLVNRALQSPPPDSTQILHPNLWPGTARQVPVRLGIASRLRSGWHRIGGGPAGEERALVILLAGALGSEAETGASGWRGGRFAVWQPRSSRRQCTGPGCVTGDVGVVAFRWRHRDDASQFRLAVPAYTTLGLFAQVLSRRAWKLSDGYVALGTAPRGSALAFAPHRHLADWLATRSARSASAYDVQSERRGPTRARQG
ncbi:MAG: hypothetical protein E6G49_02860 [Actinobacteria bacterium]|nr:MAG: hypothetical protein E6G49_02860 [Actinomycetota bacterium]